MSENTRVTKAAGIVAAATFLSRILGFVRDVVIAWFFGAGLSSDAFFVAFRIPNLLRRLFAEGSLSIAFIPVFTEYLTHQGKAEAFHLARSALRILSILLVILAILGILSAPLIIRVIAPGFADSPEKFSLTVTLTRIMFPYIFFICLVALCMGILNTLGHFAAPALAPVCLNVAIILSAFFISPHTSHPVIGLAIGVIIGGVLQLSLQIPFLMKNGVFRGEGRGARGKREPFCHAGLKRVGTLMLPAVFGASVYQVNILVGTLLASLLPEGSVSYLYYADRLVQFPLGIFAIAMATAVLPSLSRQASAKAFDDMGNTFAYAMRLIFFITLPSMAGLIVLREPIIALLFRRGAFDAATTRMTADALLCYCVGLWAFSSVRIVVSTFYALQDTKTPVKMAVISLVANMTLGIILMGPLGHGGLALSTSLASMINLGLLVHALRPRIGSLEWKSILASVCKSLICAVLMGAGVWVIAFLVFPQTGHSLPRLFLRIGVSILSGVVLYGLFSFLLKSPELTKLLAAAGKGVKR